MPVHAGESRKRILSIDGGGLRCLFAIAVLAELEKRRKRPVVTVPTALGGCVMEGYGGLISSMNSSSSQALAIAASSRSSISTSVSPSRRCSIARH